MIKNPINYSQCWEDPTILKEALSVSSEDCILSVTSGGDNTLALLLAQPSEIVSVDSNVAQNHLLELKMAAAKGLSYAEYLEFLGVKDSKNRLGLLEKVRPFLSNEASIWWSNHVSQIHIGAINSGRFEKFTRAFAWYVLPLVHSKKTVLKFLSVKSIDEQVSFYRNSWNSRRWKLFFNLATNRFILRKFARQNGMFAHTEGHITTDIYFKRLERTITHVPIYDNFFLHYSLMGKYGQVLPPYLQEKEYGYLKGNLNSNLRIVATDILSYLKSKPSNTFSKFNLSDIFEALSPSENDTLWEEIIRTAKNGARVAYWNNLVERSCPASLIKYIHTDEKRLQELRLRDRVFFYDSFSFHTIIK